MFGLKAKLIGFLVVGLVILGLVGALKYVHGRYVVAVGELAASEASHKATTAAFASYRASTEVQLKNLRESVTRMAAEYHAARSKADELSEMLSRHDFTELVRRKPGLIERRVNSGSANVLRDLKALTTDFSREGAADVRKTPAP